VKDLKNSVAMELIGAEWARRVAIRRKRPSSKKTLIHLGPISQAKHEHQNSD